MITPMVQESSSISGISGSLDSGVHLESSGNNVSHETCDVDLPIVLQKSIRSCTLHPMSKYVSYNFLSPSLQLNLTAPKALRISMKLFKSLN